MAKAEIEIRLRQGEDAFGTRLYRPNGRLRGDITVDWHIGEQD